MLADLVAVMPFVGIGARASYTGRYESTEDEQVGVFRSISAIVEGICEGKSMVRNTGSVKIVSKIIAAVVVVVASSLALAQNTPGVDQVKSEFRNPAKQYRPMARWWWPGGDVTDQEIEREVRLLDDAGFGGAEIQPFVTFDTRPFSKHEATRVNDFATPQFFQHVRAAADAAKARGMWIDFTFGSGWPFGGGLEITPELSAIELRSEDTVVEGPKTFSGKLAIPDWRSGLHASMMLQGGIKPDWPNDWQQRLDARSKIIAVVAMRGASAAQKRDPPAGDGKPKMLDGSSIVMLTDHMVADGSLKWEVPEGTWHIFVFRQIPTRQPVIAAAGLGPQLVLDHFNEVAFAAHAKRVGDPLVKAVGTDAGSSLRAIFCDSLELQQFVFWTDGFLDQFKKRRGYDLSPYLAILRQPGYNDFYFSRPGTLPLYDVGDGGDEIRADYWRTVSELIDEGFYHPFDQWASQHHLLSRVQAHGAPADLLKLYGGASIPETEQLAGGNTVNFMKLASSAGYDYGRKTVSSESFVFPGNPYITTPESIKANSDKMLISGINQIIYHGFPYDFKHDFNDGSQGIGWFPFQGMFSSHMNEHNPIWPFVEKVNQYITRLQYVAREGKSDLQVALYRSSLNEDDTGPTPGSGKIEDPFPSIENALTAAGYSFGFVNDASLQGSAAHNAKLVTKEGGQYAALVIPHETKVSPDGVKLLQAFATAKVPVIFVGGLPGENVSFKDLQQDRERVHASLQALEHQRSVNDAAGAADTASRLSEVIRPQVRFTSGETLPFLKKTLGTTKFYLLTNPTDKSATATVEFDETGAPELWDPWSGEAKRTAFTRVKGRVHVDVALPRFGSELLAFNDANQDLAPLSERTWKEVSRQVVGETGWNIDAHGMSEKGIGIDLHLSLEKLTDWLNNPELRTFSGTATYTTYVNVHEDDLKNAQQVIIDLGEVKDAAEVKVNGQSAGALVVAPFAADIRTLLHAGDNIIQVSVTNSLTNYVSTIKWPANPVNPIRNFPPTSAGLLGPLIIRFETIRK